MVKRITAKRSRIKGKRGGKWTIIITDKKMKRTVILQHVKGMKPQDYIKWYKLNTKGYTTPDGEPLTPQTYFETIKPRKRKKYKKRGLTDKTKTKRTKRKIKKERQKIERKIRKIEKQKAKGLAKLRRTYGGQLEKTVKPGEVIRNYNMQEIQQNTRKVYTDLLKPLVRDQGLIELIIANKEQIKHRIRYDTKIFGIKEGTSQEMVLGDIGDVNKTLEEYLSKYSKNFARQVFMASNYIKNLQSEIHYLVGKQYNNGQITRTITTITFVKK